MFRTAIFAGVMLAFWTLARPAHAALAPFCDDRGATALAAPPALEAPDEAIQRAAAPPCETTDTPLYGLVLGRAHAGVRSVPADAAPAGTVAPLPPLPQVSEPFAFLEGDLPPQAGARYRVERPPRD